MSIATLRALHSIISESLDQIDSIYSTGGIDFPALDLPYDESSPGEMLAKTNITVRKAIEKAVSACGHIAATLQSPFMSLSDAAFGYQLPAALRVLEGLPTALPLMAEAGVSGVHVKIIAEREGIRDEGSVSRLAHAFRLLATHHVVREISPGNIFALNRISGYTTLPSLPVTQEKVDPMKRYDGTNGVAAYMGLITDELFKAAGFFLESLLPQDHPFAFTAPPPAEKGADPASASLSPLNYAFRTRQGFFPWLEGAGAITSASKAEQDYRLRRFGNAMSGNTDFDGPGCICSALDWLQLPRGSVVVDVGGGTGSKTMILVNGLLETSTKFVVQDRKAAVELGLDIWKDQSPELLNNGTVKFQVHDFFNPQPKNVHAPAVYLLRAVLHNWADKDAQTILLRLREAASDTTTLVIGDHILPLACAETLSAENGIGIDGAEVSLALPPLLPNMGKANSNAYWLDMTMYMAYRAQERTLREFADLCASAGWNVVSIRRSAASLFGYIIAIPIPSFFPSKSPSVL